MSNYLIDEYKNLCSDNTYKCFYNDLNDKESNIVIYSGGADSTLLLYELARLKGSKDKPIKAVSFNYKYVLNPMKIKKEKEVRNRFKKYCKENKLHITFSEMDITISKNYPYPIGRHGYDGIAQPTLWVGLMGLLLLNNANIWMGYIKGDDLWMFKTEFFNAFNSLRLLAGAQSRIVIPYTYSSKKDIIKKLREYKLRDYIWYCEEVREDGKECGRCIPCKKHDSSMRELIYKTKQDRLEKHRRRLLQGIIVGEELVKENDL